MKYTVSEKLTQSAVSAIIEKGWEMEAKRDVDGAIANFAPVWPDIDLEPDFSEIEPSQRAALYRLSGFFLSIYGNVRNLKTYQERAKNLLSQSVEIYSRLDDRYGVADAQNVLAVCYLNEGAILEAETILKQTADDFLGNHLHPVYLRNRNNLLQTTINRKNYQASIEIIEEMRVPIEFCSDHRVCCLFHEKAGIVYRGLGQYEKAIGHYNEAIRFAYLLDNLLFVSSQKNNLAFLYNKIRNFPLAHRNIDEAITIAIEQKFSGWLPNFLDTQALIFANEGNYAIALETIEKVINLLEGGDDYFNLAEAIWNKCRFLLQLDRKEEALMLFSELIPLAGQRMGEFAVKQFTREFSDLIHVKQEGSSLDDEIRRFRRNEIAGAIRKANFGLREAAGILHTDTANLSRILEKEFPDLYLQIDFRQPKMPQPVPETPQPARGRSIPRTIAPLLLSDVEMTIDGSPAAGISTFYIAAEILPETLGVDADVIVAVSPHRKPEVNSYALVHDPVKDSYFIGQIHFDKALNLSYLSDRQQEFPVLLDDLEVIGQIAGWCPFSAIDRPTLAFSSIGG